MTAPRLSLPKRLLYGTIVALVVVALLFGLLEGSLRLLGYGHSPRYFRTERAADGSRWIRENRDFTLTYFPPVLVRRPQAMRLPASKPEGTYRIFVLGSSAAMGDPEASFSLARLLEAMLREAYPQRRCEVVNAAVTAINSHVVRAIAEDCAELQPDLFIVYEGNNEVIGPFGPAAVLAPFLRSPTAINFVVTLKRSRSGQLLGTLLPRRGATGDQPEDWGGMAMFLEQEIAFDDPRLADVQASFAHNLRAIAGSAQSAGARTLLCTVLANQKDFAPFHARHRADLTADELARWDEALAAGIAAGTSGDWPEAERHFRAAWAIDAHHAELAFRLGRICLAQGRDAEAAALLQRALDTDTLRFRTDSALNGVIRATAEALPETTELVDLATQLAATSPHGIPGDETLYEHVHLTFRGTWEAARVLFERVSVDLLQRRLIPAVRPAPFSYDEARARLGYTTYEQAMIIHELRQRFARPPFTGQLDHAVRTAMWDRRAAAADELLQRPGTREALITLYEQAIAAAPDDWVLQRNYGMMLVAMDAAERALPVLEKARAIIADDPDLLFALATAQRATHRETAARATFAALRQLEPRYPGLPPTAAE